MLIDGAAGIGKTALLDVLAEGATQRGLTVLRARGGVLERELTWDVTRQLLTAVVMNATPARRSELLSGPAGVCEQVLGLSPPGASPVQFSQALHGLRWLVANLSRDRPLLVAVDDAQWADRESLRFLAYLVDRVTDGALLVAVATRIGDPNAQTKELAGLRDVPAAVTLRPQPLSLQASMELVRRLLDGDAQDAVYARLAHTAGGNPVLLHELCRELRQAPAAATIAATEAAEANVAARVARGLSSRLARFPPHTSASAEAAAILGRCATLHRVAQLLRLAPDEVADAVGELVEADILVHDRHLLGFVHPLIRRAVYDRVPLSNRQVLHGRAAQILAEEDASPEDIAAQLLVAAPAAEPWRVAQLRRAAGRALSAGAPETASRLLQRALIEPPRAAERYSVLVELGGSERHHDPSSAIAHLSEAIDAAASPRARIDAVMSLAGTHALLSDFPSAVRLLSAAAADAGEEQPELVRRLDSARLAFSRWDYGSQPLRRQLFEALRRRSAAGADLDPMERANLAHELAAIGEDRELAIASARSAIRAAPRGAASESSTVLGLTSVLLLSDLCEEADEIALTAVRSARDRGSDVDASMGLTLATQCALRRGNLLEALERGYSSLDLATGVWSTGAVAWLVEALGERGEFVRAEELLAEHGLGGPVLIEPGAAGAGYQLVAVLHHRARMRALAGDTKRALQDVQVVRELGAAWDVRNPAVLDWRSAAATALVSLRRHDEAGALIEEELRLARRWGAASVLGTALRAAGLCDPGPAGTELLREAAAVHASSPARLEHARTLVTLGMRLRRERRRLEAQELLRQGLDLAHHCGATVLAEQARGELIAAGARPRRNAVQGPASLTARELRIAELARDGHTNSQIARTLFVSPRTVEHHLRNIYRKLSIQSRGELIEALSGRRS